MRDRSGHARVEAAAKQMGWDITPSEQLPFSIFWSRLYALDDLILEVVYEVSFNAVYSATLSDGETEYQLGIRDKRKAERVIDVLQGKTREF